MAKITLIMAICFVAAFFTLISIVGCATTRSAAAKKIQEVNRKAVENCKYVGDVQGSSGWGGLASSAGIQNAKNEALEKALELGATHVVWVDVSGSWASSASGRAYICK